ncbi:PEPTIDYL-PROLYL CIS-TRANS ISOMERASE FKBP19 CHLOROPLASTIC [Salix viminalis]|uniref:peptidylprolyl isomerase n=1 Tax=Salix viminalis TaxID=40686 RepID=A0A9Q0TLC7_SALVM|nr:PEPTIDYL-PROLYL CIS-TRANS ISOMERASE FKBP19 CHLOROPLASTIC [Salix viminalis]
MASISTLGIPFQSPGRASTSTHSSSNKDAAAMAAEFADMPALRGKDYGKTKMRYPDYTETESGLQYKDLRAGNGPLPKMGEIVVVDWDGYTIGYYGRIFEARNKTKDDKDFFKFRLGSREVIPAFEEAVSGMALGSIRRIICAKTNNIFGSTSLGFRVEEPRADRQNFAVRY